MKTYPTRERVSELDGFLSSIGDDDIKSMTLPGIGIDADKANGGLCEILRTQYDTIKDKEGESIPYYVASARLLELAGTDETNKEGRFSVRLCKHLKLEYGIKANDEVKSLIGNLYNDCKEVAKDFRFDVTNDFSWEDGEFGKSGSCWWGSGGNSYSDSRDSLYNSGGFGLRLYNDRNRGNGRVWLYPENDRIYLFNAYGIDIKDAARIVLRLYADYTGEVCKFRTCSIESPSWFYVNGAKGSVVYKNSDSREDFNTDLCNTLEHECGIFENLPEYTCDSCGDGVDEDDVHSDENGNSYCESCYDELFSHCDKCDGEYRRDEVNEICGNRRYSYLCDDCMESIGASECEECNTYNGKYIITHDTERVLCDSCQSGVIYCEKCNEYFENETSCPDCIEEEVINE